MQAVLAYVDAQREYYLRNPQKSKLLQYAQKFISSRASGTDSTIQQGGRAAEPVGARFSKGQGPGLCAGRG